MLQPPDYVSPPDRPAQFLPPASPAPMSEGLLLGVVVAIIAVFGDFVIFSVASSHAGRPDVPVVTIMCLAWITSGLGLLIVWLGLGGGRLYLRLLAVGLVAALAILVIAQGRWSVEAFAGFVLFLVAGAMPFGLLYIVGFEMLSAETVRVAGSGDAGLRRGQFSLRQLFGWTLAATLVASVARFARLAPNDLLGFSVIAGVFSLIAVGSVYAALRPGRTEMVVLRIVILCVSTMMLVGGVTVLFSRARGGLEDMVYLLLTSLAHVLFMLVVLLLYRRLGYRLQRRG